MKLNRDEGWLVPSEGPDWLNWGFGTRQAVSQTEIGFAKQVHGVNVFVVNAPGLAGEADALITNQAGLPIGIKTADCMPILMADLNHRVVAAVHAGWRGTARQIVQIGISKMEELFKTKSTDLLVALGPAIGKCCFEVGPEVARQFTQYDPALKQVTNRCHLDLGEINRQQLEEAGVPSNQILYMKLCTYCDEERFWSYRREGEKAGRMWSVVEILG